MKEITLTKGFVALVDDDDYYELSKHSWCYAEGYAIRSVKKESGAHTTCKMHILIIGKREGFQVDHINGNGLDNRKSNLRYATQKENSYNSKSNKGGTSKYKGVRRQRDCKNWRARIQSDGKPIDLGYFSDEKEAAIAYNNAATELHGEYARLNIIIKEE